MASPVDHILKVFRSQFNNKLASTAKTEPIAVTVQQYLLPVMRELVDDSENRSRIANRATPAFPCTLQKRTVTETPTGMKSTITNKCSVALWNSVLPWETALGLSHVDLFKYQPNKKDTTNSDENNQDKKEIAQLPHGMLFTSRGIIEATSDLKGNFVPNAPLNFWSGAIRESIDVLYLQSKQPLPHRVTYLRRKEGELSETLTESLRNGYGCKTKDVMKLDPFPEQEEKSPLKKKKEKENNEAAVGESSTSKNSSSMFSFIFGGDDAHHQQRSHSANSPPTKNAPFFVLELPAGFIEKNLTSNGNESTEDKKQQKTTSMMNPLKYTSSKNQEQCYVELVLGKEIADDIDKKMLFANTILPIFQESVNTTLRRMCTEVLQRGAKYVREVNRDKMKRRGGSMHGSKNKNEVDNDDDDEHLWTDADTEFLCLASRLAVSDYDLLFSAWDCLADYIHREEMLQKNGQEECGFFDLALREKEGGEQEDNDGCGAVVHNVREKSFDMIWELIHDGSVILPHSIIQVMNNVKKNRD